MDFFILINIKLEESPPEIAPVKNGTEVPGQFLNLTLDTKRDLSLQNPGLAEILVPYASVRAQSEVKKSVVKNI